MTFNPLDIDLKISPLNKISTLWVMTPSLVLLLCGNYFALGSNYAPIRPIRLNRNTA